MSSINVSVPNVIMRLAIQLILVSTFFLICFNTSVFATDRLTQCRKSIMGSKKCSDHVFMESLSSLQTFKNKSFDDVIEEIRCLNKNDNDKTYFSPSDCGKMYGKFVKDVRVTFDEAGWFKKTYTFNGISFKIIGGQETFQDIIQYLKNTNGVSMIKVDTKDLVICEKREIWKDEVFEYRQHLSDLTFQNVKSCTLDTATECIMKSMEDASSLELDNTPLGSTCRAEALLQNERGNIKGQLYIHYHELDDFDYKNVAVSYYPINVSYD